MRLVVGDAMAKGRSASARVAPLRADLDGRMRRPPPCSEAGPPHDTAAEQRGFVVGFALTKKKTKSFIQPKLLALTRSKGISLVEIDRSIPLVEQGPFDVILHKLTGKEWRQELEDYVNKYPSSTVLDSPEAIQHLRSRQSMLQAVADVDLRHYGGKVGVPKQLVVVGEPSTIPSLVHKAGLKFPLVVKPLVADGSPKSHAMWLAHDESCLPTLDPPLVLQEFVNHGGVLFKVYVIGDSVRVVRRLSLPDVHEGQRCHHALMPFARVSSNAAAAAARWKLNEAAELPPERLLHALAAEVRRRLGLRLFNMDIIRKDGSGDDYYVIDINYFPGYGKMPEYELVFTDFLLRLAQRKNKESDCRE